RVYCWGGDDFIIGLAQSVKQCLLLGGIDLHCVNQAREWRVAELPKIALHVPKRWEKYYKKRLKIAEADGRTDILIPVDFRRVVSRVAAARDLPLVVVPC